MNNVACLLNSVCLTEPIEFIGLPIYYEINSVYGYLCASGENVLFFYMDSDGSVAYDILAGWFVEYDMNKRR